MLLLFSVRVAEWQPVWERAVYSLTFISMCVFFFLFRFLGWDVGFDCINS